MRYRYIEDVFNNYIKCGGMPQRFMQKNVFSMDKFDFSQNGIIHKNIIDWLLKK